jgi:hypothetical protein
MELFERRLLMENKIYSKVMSYIEQVENDKHHRYKSWEHCYNYFGEYINLSSEDQEKDISTACLNLGFYLSSWGMMRSSFLLQKDYFVHEYLLRTVVMDKSNNIFRGRVSDNNIELDKLILSVRTSYVDIITSINGIDKKINVSDTLASKILLGIYGCVPAYDRFFIVGMKLHGIKGMTFNSYSIKHLVNYCNQNEHEFNKLKIYIDKLGKDYPIMKLLDMYFWQCGYEADKEGLDIPNAVGGYTRTKKTVKTSNVEEVRVLIRGKLSDAKTNGKEYLDLRSGDIHKELDYSNRMPTVCGAMESINGIDYKVIHDTPSGKSSTKVLRYLLKY